MHQLMDLKLPSKVLHPSLVLLFVPQPWAMLLGYAVFDPSKDAES